MNRSIKGEGAGLREIKLGKNRKKKQNNTLAQEGKKKKNNSVLICKITNFQHRKNILDFQNLELLPFTQAKLLIFS